MKNIDFLPEHFHHQRVLQHSQRCWVGVASLFGLAITGAAVGQWYLHRVLEAQLRNIEPQYAISQQQQAEVTKLIDGRKRVEDLMALYLYLEHPWPKTQLLAAVAQPLTASIQLTSLQLVDQADSTSVARGPESDTNRVSVSVGKSESVTPESALVQMRQAYDRQRTILELGGVAGNAKELHEYVDALAKSPLFASASLKGLESGGDDPAKKLSKFSIRVVVHAGLGQPGTPSRKAHEGDIAVSEAFKNVRAGTPGGLP